MLRDQSDNNSASRHRLLVYVGYNHAYKGTSDVAGTRKRVLVDALFNTRREESLVLASRSAPGEFHSFDRSKADMMLFHRPTRFEKGRPDWLAMDGYRRPRPIPAKLLPQSGRRLIQAFNASESVDAVPVDQVIVKAGEPAPVFMLPKGKFRFAFDE